ncbi:MAG: NADH-quinone oxidoreductase subunit C [Clostridiales bacterium]|nr:NADH-quinone oxidoreductase subunit C [Clostridiales bacterium]
MQEFKSFDIKKDEIVPLAQKMKDKGYRLVMIHGYVDKEGNNVVNYQYEVGNCIESYKIVGENVLPSISHIYDLSAAWPEEELFELMGVQFEGLEMRGRLFLPDTMLEGQGHIIVTPLDELRKKTLREGE